MQNEKCKVQNEKCKVQNEKCKVQNAKCKMKKGVSKNQSLCSSDRRYERRKLFLVGLFLSDN